MKDIKVMPLRNVKVVLAPKVGNIAFGPGYLVDADTGEKLPGLIQSMTIKTALDDFPQVEVVMAGALVEIDKVPAQCVEIAVACERCGAHSRFATVDELHERFLKLEQALLVRELHNGSGFPVAVAKA
jgi:hypothetical protein